MRFRITDGDLVIILHPRYKSGRADTFKTTLVSWCEERGLHNVKFVVQEQAREHADECNLEVMIFSVNDVFEEQVLNK